MPSTPNRCVTWCSAVLVAWAMLTSQVRGEPVGSRMLDEVHIRGGDQHAVVSIRLTVPFQYLDHFPHEAAKELLIRIQPQRAAGLEQEDFAFREATRPYAAEQAALLEVSYEGNRDGNHYLVLEFKQPVSYEVFPGTDYRSVSVVVITHSPCESP